MAREPNQTEARGMWDVTRPNQQRNAIYGERWPLPALPIPPAWSGNRYFSYYGYNGSYVGSYTYNNSRSFAVAWSTVGASGMFTSAQYAYTGKQSNQTRFLNSSMQHSGSTWGNVIEYVTCATLGWAGYFGDAIMYTNGARGGSNGTIGIYAGGQLSTTSSATDLKKYVNIASTGNGNTYGTLYARRERGASSSGATYYSSFGGYGNGGTNWDYVNFTSSGNSSLAGNLEGGGSPRYIYDSDSIDGGTGSSRIVMAGGAWQNGGHGNAMFHYSTASWGVGTDYANMANAREANSTTGDGTVGVIAGGQGQQAYESGTLIFTIDTLAAATVGANALATGVTRNGMAVGNQ